MKKYFVQLLITSVFVTSIFSFTVFAPTTSAYTTPTTVSQLVELLIALGVIPSDKVVAARAAVTSLSQASISTSTTTTITVPATTVRATTTVSTSTPAVYLQVLTPNGSERWELAVTVPYLITWGSTKDLPVSLGLVSGTKGVICNLTPTPISSKVGNNSYKIYLNSNRCYSATSGTSTAIIDGSYKVRVSYTGPTGAVVKDESDANFSIVPVPIPSIKVTYPNGGEKLVTSTNYDIKYSVKNTSERGLKFYFLNEVGNSMYSVTAFGDKGTYRLRLPSSLTDGAYKLKIEMTLPNTQKIEDTSDNLFWISHN